MVSKHRVEKIIKQLYESIASNNTQDEFDAIALANRLLGTELPSISDCYEETVEYSGTVTRNAKIIVEILSEYLDSYANLSFNVDDYITRDIELNKLLSGAIQLYNDGNLALAVEKLWDAFERLKTYFILLKKSESAEKVIKTMSNGDEVFISMYTSEFRQLTDIGNQFRIRHHETNKINITDNKDYEYFFMRCLALICSAISRVQKMDRNEI